MSVRDVIEKHVLYKKIKENFKFSHPLSLYTSFKIGGDGEVIYEPCDVHELQELSNFFLKHDFNVSLIGNGSNLLISDSGISGVLIKLSKFKDISIVKEEGDDIFLNVGAGALVDDVINFCVDKGISGMEDFAGLPASIGGASFMNARCYESSFSDLLFSIKCMIFSKEGCIFVNHKVKQKEWAYKSSPFQKNTMGIRALEGRHFILSVVLHLKRGSEEEIRQKASERYKTRVEKRQFEFPSAGSVFKNDYNVGIPTGKLVSESGLLGLSRGGAQVSAWHGNFIINRGGAKAKDVIDIMNIIREEIKKRYALVLEPEIIYCD